MLKKFKIDKKNYAAALLVTYLLIIVIALIIKEIVLITFALIGVLVYYYRHKINAKLKNL